MVDFIGFLLVSITWVHCPWLNHVQPIFKSYLYFWVFLSFFLSLSHVRCVSLRFCLVVVKVFRAQMLLWFSSHEDPEIRAHNVGWWWGMPMGVRCVRLDMLSHPEGWRELVTYHRTVQIFHNTERQHISLKEGVPW